MQLPAPFDRIPVVYAPVEREPDLVEIDANVWASDEVLVIDMDAVAVRVEGLERVVVEVRDAERAREAGLPDLLGYGAVVRALCAHDGRFCMHASLVAWDHGPVLVAGHRGAGKSTTVTHLAQTEGAELLVDDVVPLDVVAGGVIAHPYQRPVHLLPDAATRLEITPHADGPTVGSGEYTKHALDLARGGEPVAVARMVMITRREAGAGGPPLVVREATGADRLRLVVRASNSSGYSSLGRRAPQFVAWSLAVASGLQVLEIDRDLDLDTLDEVGRVIREWAQTPAPIG